MWVKLVPVKILIIQVISLLSKDQVSTLNCIQNTYGSSPKESRFLMLSTILSV